MTEAPDVPSELVIADDALAVFGNLNIGVERATAVANQLKPIVDSCGLAVRIGQGEHLKVEAWVTCGMFCGVSPHTEWTQEVRNPVSGDLDGYKARVQVIRMATGEAIGAAECSCHFDEQQKRRDGSGLYDRWSEHGRQNRHACMSMAQTRATSKALAQALRWIPVLAGYSGTPFEEMPPEPREDHPKQRPKAEPQATQPAPAGNGTLSKDRIKSLRIYASAFRATEAVHGKGDDWDKIKFKSLHWALERMGFARVDKVPDERGEELASLIPEYAEAVMPPQADGDAPF